MNALSPRPSRRAAVRHSAAILLLWAGTSLGLSAQQRTQQSSPAAAVLPDSPLKARMAQIAQPPAAPAGTAKPPAKADLLRPELSFTPREDWLLLPELGKRLGEDDEQRAALVEILTAGAAGLREALAAEGAGNDVGAAAALFVVQLWQFARNVELPQAHSDAVHAQIVATLAVPEVARMRDADKQRFWEFCLGVPLLMQSLAESVEGDEQQAQLRQAAGGALEALLGVALADLDLGAHGLARRSPRPPAPAAAAGSAPGSRALPSTGPAIAAVTYTPPAGWTRETKDGNVLFRATLADVDRSGQPEANNQGSHQATIGFLPVLTAKQGPTALFDQTWRDQFGGFDLGDTLVH
ncbi:MAG: hypothetical protein FJ265_13280, partial [Planctomycetes bacterium]|nr:hypothetical protein [Planctomycetota bacterium]